MHHLIDIESWERKDLFRFFQKFDNPTWDIMSDVRITAFYQATKEAEASFFLSFLYVATKVLNGIPAFRHRIDADGHVREYDIIHPGSTILYDNGTFGFGYFNLHQDFKTYLKEAATEFENQKTKKDLDPKDDDLGRIYFSPIPWITFTGFRHPFDNRANHSVPRVVFGKHHEKDGERLMPVGLTIHHGLADGYHAGLFFNQLQNEMDDPWKSMQLTRPA